jgi:tRNA threonylcarbamoyladenosine biosynthesis protein TsaB
MKSRPERPRELVLGIDAATPAGGVALASVEGRLLAQVWRAEASPIARFLMPDVDRLMRETGARADEIKAVAVTHGPGAFTGLRLGLAVAKTLAHGWTIPVYPYSTLATIARRWPMPGSLVGVLLDARRGELYSGLYRIAEGAAPLALRAECVETLQGFVTAMASELVDSTLYLTGSGALKHRAALEGALGPRARWIEAPWEGPAADVVAMAGAIDLREGRPGVDALNVEPLYLRASDAERRLKPVT